MCWCVASAERRGCLVAVGSCSILRGAALLRVVHGSPNAKLSRGVGRATRAPHRRIQFYVQHHHVSDCTPVMHSRSSA
jgi:hypothetical protein